MHPQIHKIEGLLKIGDSWVAGQGASTQNLSPVDNQITWHGAWADPGQAAQAVGSAIDAFDAWRLRSLEDRWSICQSFAKVVESKREELARYISFETGKPYWEALSEVATVIGKVANSMDALKARRWETREQQSGFQATTRYRAHGAMLVLGPFNLPAHLPGAHIVPALLAGNTVVFKPSEMTPGVGQWLVHAWCEAGLPPGVLNLIHGNAQIAQSLASDNRLAGILFTGSYRAGASLHKQLAGKPEKVLALEMGGNNPLVVHRLSDLAVPVMQIIESAYITSGQRCTCARRLIITEEGQSEVLLPRLVDAIRRIRVGLPFDKPDPFMGTLIRSVAADRMLEAQSALIARGAISLLKMDRVQGHGALLSPGLLDTTGIALDDEEHFGPLLTVQRVKTLDDAIALANETRFGLSAGLLSDSEVDYHYFVDRIQAGIVNWNRQTTGASGRLPFGGIGASGNHAPSGFFASDYCSYPIASLESPSLDRSALKKLSPGLEEAAQACSAN